MYYLIKGQIESAKDEVLGLYEVTKKTFKIAFAGVLVSTVPTLIFFAKGILDSTLTMNEVRIAATVSALATIVPLFLSIKLEKKIDGYGTTLLGLDAKAQSIDSSYKLENQDKDLPEFSEDFKLLLIDFSEEIALRLKNIRNF